MPRTLCPSNNTDNNKDDNAQILVSVLNPLSPKKAATEEPVEEQTQPTITLEVLPSSFRSPLSSPIHLVRFGVELRNLVSIMILQQVPGLTFPPDDIKYSGNHDNHSQTILNMFSKCSVFSKKDLVKLNPSKEWKGK